MDGAGAFCAPLPTAARGPSVPDCSGPDPGRVACAPDSRLHEPIKYGFFNATPTARFPAFFSIIINYCCYCVARTLSLSLSLLVLRYAFYSKLGLPGQSLQPPSPLRAALWRPTRSPSPRRTHTGTRCDASSPPARSLKCP